MGRRATRELVAVSGVGHRTAHAQLRLTYVVLLCAVVAFSIMQSLVVPVLSEIALELRSDQATTSWVVTAYLLSASICTPLLGRIGDGIGRRRALAFSLGALTVGSLLAGMSTSIEMLIAARVVQGVGGGVLPLSFGIVRDEFPDTKVASVVSVLAATGALGFAAGVAIGGPMVELLGFRSLFLVPALVTGASIFAAICFVPESPARPKEPLPVLPALLLASWLTAFLLPISKGSDWGWDSPLTLTLLSSSIVLMVAWATIESRASFPFIDMRMMRLRPIWSANVLSLVVGFAMFACLALVPQLLQTPSASGFGLGMSMTESGVALLPCGLATFLTGLLSIPVTRRLGIRRVLAGALLLWAGALFAMATNRESAVALAGGMSVMGVGLGLLMAALAAAVVEAAPAHQTGAASGMHANLRAIGGAAGAAITSAIVTAAPVPGFSASGPGYTLGFFLIGAVLLAATPLTLLLPARASSTDDPTIRDRVAETACVAD